MIFYSAYLYANWLLLLHVTQFIILCTRLNWLLSLTLPQIAELRKELTDRGLNSKGNKAELLDRLTEFLDVGGKVFLRLIDCRPSFSSRFYENEEEVTCYLIFHYSPAHTCTCTKKMG